MERNQSTKIKRRQQQLLTAYETELIIYIKVLLEAQKSIPNIVKILDKIINQRASTLIPTYAIMGSSCSTYSEINKVIDLSARKNKLLNIYALTESILNYLNKEEQEIINLRFVSSLTIKEISKKVFIPERTLYRTITRIIEKLAINMLNDNLTTKYIKKQLSPKEPWLLEIYARKKYEEDVNKRRGDKQIEK